MAARTVPAMEVSTSLMTRSNFIDIGANLTDPVFIGIYRGKQRHASDLLHLLKRAHDYGVDRIITTAGSVDESRAALSLSRGSYPSPIPKLYSTVGVHPTRCNEFLTALSDQESSKQPDEIAQSHLSKLLQVCKDGIKDAKVVAIGECGLDYDRLEFCSRETQRIYFEKQFELAEATNLPMFLHNRNTNGDFYEIVARNRHRFKHGVVHSFTGDREEADKLLGLDLYIGINGCSLKTQENLQVVKSIPASRLMLETDAPWCDIRATHAGYQHVHTKWPSKKAEKYDHESLVKGRNEPCTMM
uniref:Deoxyribonuclease TATDN1like protein putative n=1 Tax=Albugo laibachii Nc14 TaxID=890382 RepID=F0VYX3_9STRA|nr:deoxyribonuclease TATDN1like protein putative [Albugo laibachii Nc14]|eukprot:CCA13988.1 deoxyribonuclease TATDN1like protein putative [Albugo laibachii Nc14]